MRKQRRTMQATIEIYPAVIITITNDYGEQNVTPVALTNLGEVLRFLWWMLSRRVTNLFAPIIMSVTGRFSPVTARTRRSVAFVRAAGKGLTAEGIGACVFGWIMGRSFVWATVCI